MSAFDDPRHEDFLRFFTEHEPAVRAFVRRLVSARADAADEAHAAVAEVTVQLRQGEQLELYLASLDTRNPRSLAEHTGPGIALEWLEVEGPLDAPPRFFGVMPVELWTAKSGLIEPPAPTEVIKSGKRAKQRKNESAPRYMVVSREPLRDAERLLRAFMERAFRRPIPEGEVERYLTLGRAKLDAKFCFQEALRTGLKAVLCSPDFLFFQESGADFSPRSTGALGLKSEPLSLDDFALESFDVMGAWRTRYRSLGDGDKVNATFRGKPVDYRLGPPVDASGEIASGAKSQDIAGFRKLLLADREQLARNLAAKLLVYATGAGVQYADRAEIEAILARAKASDYGLRSIVHEVVQSKVFQQK